MPGGLRESLVSAAGGRSTQRPAWVTPQDLANCVSCSTMVDLAMVCRAVSQNLYVLSGRRFGQRLTTARPAPYVQCGGMSIGYTGGWSWADGLWGYGETELTLNGPVQEVVSVKVDGRELDPGEVKLYDGCHLVRVDPINGQRLLWPSDQRLDLDDDQTNTFSVTWFWGADYPDAGILAARQWACFIANNLAALQGEGDCALPDRVIAYTRQGVTLDRLSAFDFLKEGKTGVDAVDQWVNIVNPRGLRRAPVLASPDTIRGWTE